MTIRLGLIGYGKWGQKIAAEITRTPGFELGAISVRKRVNGLPGPGPSHGWYSQWEDMLSLRHNLPLDGIIAACPPQMNVEIARACAKVDMPLWLEKPMALSVADALIIHTVCKEARLPVLVDHVYIFHPLWQQIKTAVALWQGPITAHCRSEGPGPVRDFSAAWDWGAHDVAALIDLFGSPLTATGSEWLPGVSTRREGEHHGRMTWATGHAAYIVANNRAVKKYRSIGLDCPDHGLTFDPSTMFAHMTINSLRMVPLTTPLPLTPLQLALHEFGAMITSGTPMRDHLTLGLETVKALATMFPSRAC